MPTRRRPAPPVLASALAAVLAAAGLASPRGAAAQEPVELFLESVEVEVVNVEVVVTDAEGRPVHGLAREDFRVREDGRPVELTNFYAVAGGRRVVAEEEGTAPEESLAALPEDQKLHLVVLVDNANLSPTSRNLLLRDLRARLAEVLRPGDRALVAAANPEVRVVLPFTDDPAAVASTLERLERTAPRRGLLDAEARMILREIDEGAASLAGGGSSSGFGSSGETPQTQAREALDMIRAWAAERHTHNLRLLSTLQRFVEALAGLPGRRAVIYVSEGFAPRPSQALLEQWFETFASVARAAGVASAESEAAEWDATAEVLRLTELAAGNQVAFYTLESGSVFHDALDPEVRQVRSPSRSTELLERGALADLAWRTGGVAVLAGGDVDVLVDRMVSDYRSYYSLGYASPHSNDGAFHRLEVEVPDRDVRVRHTQGFRATTAEQKTVERTLSALAFDVADNPLAVRLEVGREERSERDRFVLPVLVRIPISHVTLVPREAEHHGRLSVVVAVQDGSGRVSAPQRLEVPVVIPNARLLEAVDLQVAKGINLLVRRGESKLAVGVTDELSGTTATLNLSFAVGMRE